MEKLELRKRHYNSKTRHSSYVSVDTIQACTKSNQPLFKISEKHKDKDKRKDCLQMIKFGMSNTLVSFRDKFFEYGGDEKEDERGLSIGGYESAWLTDLVASYILEETKHMFIET